MRTTAERIVQEAVNRGWDQPPALLAVVVGRENKDGPAAIAVFEIPFAAYVQDNDEDATDVLRRLAADTPHQTVLREAAQGLASEVDGVGLCAIALVLDIWTHKVDNIDEALAFEDAGTSPADIPGGLESKLVVIVDTAGRGYILRHDRGTTVVDSWAYDASQLTPTAILDGNPIEAVRDVLLSIAAYMPEGAADLVAISRIKGYTSVREVPDAH